MPVGRYSFAQNNRGKTASSVPCVHRELVCQKAVKSRSSHKGDAAHYHLSGDGDEEYARLKDFQKMYGSQLFG